ncbi:uncharacterized protein LOC108716799 [Xenopus laevis]|uniref:Uncharacterized protein LOC108716799 n=1 Tax=Xenopus laevis TaxID=8355 RepID=A0A8J0VBE9_XENLA|nr:uncharacterized protein LOC108716799 [Xenopus laevis]
MSAYITAQLTREIRELGHRTDQVESKLDEVVVQVNAHDASIARLSAQHDDLLERLEDYENRSRRNNIRIRGLSEDVKDLHTDIPALLATLVPEMPKTRLELDRVHRALGPRRDSGIPRDIVLRFHYYASKETVMAAVRGVVDLTYNSHPYQIFSDLAGATIQRRRALALLHNFFDNTKFCTVGGSHLSLPLATITNSMLLSHQKKGCPFFGRYGSLGTRSLLAVRV